MPSIFWLILGAIPFYLFLMYLSRHSLPKEFVCDIMDWHYELDKVYQDKSVIIYKCRKCKRIVKEDLY